MIEISSIGLYGVRFKPILRIRICMLEEPALGTAADNERFRMP